MSDQLSSRQSHARLRIPNEIANLSTAPARNELTRLRLLAREADSDALGEGACMRSVWQDVLKQRLSIATTFSDATRHYVVLREGAPVIAEPLSQRECDILSRVLLGRTGKSIAQEIGLAGSTVATYGTTGLRKLGMQCREHAVPLALLMRVEYQLAAGRTTEYMMDGAIYVVVSVALSDFCLNSELTAAQSRVLRLLLSGASNADIAVDRRTCLHTAENQVAVVFGKFSVSNRFRLLDPVLEAGQPVSAALAVS